MVMAKLPLKIISALFQQACKNVELEYIREIDYLKFSQNIKLIQIFKMSFREKLILDVRTYLKQCKWKDLMHDQIIEILQIRPPSPFIYLQKKICLKSKFDNTKHHAFLAQLLIYCHLVNPITTTKEDIQNKILYLCVDKYQHTKIRRAEAVNIINSLFILAQISDKQKQYFSKLALQQLQADTITVLILARALYATILFISMKKQIDQLDAKLEQIGQHINLQIFQHYLASVEQNCSIIKMQKVQLEEHSDLYKMIAVSSIKAASKL